jgi:hypothetical protein
MQPNSCVHYSYRVYFVRYLANKESHVVKMGLGEFCIPRKYGKVFIMLILYRPPDVKTCVSCVVATCTNVPKSTRGLASRRHEQKMSIACMSIYVQK